MKRLLGLILLCVVTLAGPVMAQEANGETNTPPRRRTLSADELRAQRLQRAEDAWNKLSVEAKVHLMRVHDALVEMPADERRLIHQHIEKFLNMTQAERDQLKKNLDRWKTMTPEERAHAREIYQQRHRDSDNKNSSTNTPPAAVPPATNKP